jgi:putative oxidoreductase
MPATTQTDRFTHDQDTARRETAARDTAPAPAPAAGPGPLTDIGLLAGRVLVGFVMAAHGYQKLFDIGPAAFGTSTLAPLGVPMPTTVGYLVTFTELIGGLLLMAGLLTRFAAFALIVDLAFAIVLVKSKAPLIVAPDQPGAGLELDLALIAGFAVALLAGAKTGGAPDRTPPGRDPAVSLAQPPATAGRI